MNKTLRNWLVGIALSLAVFGNVASSCQAPQCPQGTVYDADDGECEAPEGGDDD